MGIKNMQQAFFAICFLSVAGLSACQTSTVTESTTEPETTDTTATKRLSPPRVDIRGSIIRDRYNQGQVILEVEGTPSPNSRYNRAVVLVLPTTQIVGLDGRSVSLSELRMGQNVAILLRGGGRGNLDGMGTARKIWIEEMY